MLTKDEIALYEELGYLVVPDVFTGEDVYWMDMWASSWHGSDFEVCLNIHRKSPLFLDIAKDKQILDIVRSVQKTDFDIVNDQYLYKEPGTKYAKQAWQPHQDSTYVNAPYGTYLQIHIMINDHNKRNGGIYFYPGSHKEPMLPYTYTKSWRETPDKDGVSHPGWKVDVPAKYERIDMDVKAGTVFVQHGNLIHGSYANLSERPRAQYSIAYLNKGVKINTGVDSVKIPVAVE